MGKPPSKYALSADLSLPSDGHLSSRLVQGLQPGNDLIVASVLAGSDGMYPGAKAIMRAIFKAEDIDPPLWKLLCAKGPRPSIDNSAEPIEPIARDDGSGDADRMHCSGLAQVSRHHVLAAVA